MKTAILTSAAALAAALCAGVAHADAITTLYNTGVDNAGNALPDGTAGDPHYTLSSVPQDQNEVNLSTTDVLVRSDNSQFPLNVYSGNGVGATPYAAWIGPANDYALDGPTGEYDFQTTFDLTGFDPNSAVIGGEWAVDNKGLDIFLNGNPLGITSPGFGGWTNFSISGPNLFQSGVNTLDFVINNDGGPTGLIVNLSGTADRIGVAATPEPASWAALGLGALGLLALARRARKTA